MYIYIYSSTVIVNTEEKSCTEVETPEREREVVCAGRSTFVDGGVRGRVEEQSVCVCVDS